MEQSIETKTNLYRFQDKTHGLTQKNEMIPAATRISASFPGALPVSSIDRKSTV